MNGSITERPDDDGFVTALRGAADQSTAIRPGQLKLRLQARLADDAPTEDPAVRGRLHRAVVAAEEHVPSRLISLAPLTENTLHRLASELAERRGWAYEAALSTTWDWAAALELEILPPSSPSIS
jgi:hypothetical protein